LLQVDEPADSAPRHRKIEKELDNDDDDVVDLLGANMLVPTLSLEQVLQLLVDGQPLAPNELGIFSNLTAAEAREVARRWPEIAGELRAAIVSTLVGLDEGVVILDLGEFLRVALADSFAPVRVWAIEGLHEVLSADLLTRFIALARTDEDAGVRAAAAEALGPFVLAGELDEFDAALAMRAEQTLLELLGDETQPAAVQCRALESIAYSGEAGVRQLIEESYYDDNDELRVAAVVAMGRSADTHWRRIVVAELSSASPRMRAEACYACGELEATAGRSALLELLLDEEEAVRLGAIFALARVGGEQARDALRLVADGDDDVLAEAAVVALEEMLFYTGDEAEAAPLFDDDNDDDMDDDFDDWESGPDAGDEPPARRRR
jgi:HEAT repeat protein